MLFSEVYSSYYNAVARILSRACAGGLTDREIYDIVREKAFGESVMIIPDALKSGTWPLLSEDNTTPLDHPPTMPLTDLEKRWLRSLLDDPRIKLFSPPVEGLEDVRPLFSPEDFVYFDRYSDGDDYSDPDYISRFDTVLTAIRRKRRIRIAFVGGRGRRQVWNCIPFRLEYSAKDDKFRVIVYAFGRSLTVNMARLTDCELLGEYPPEAIVYKEPAKKSVVLELRDERNSLERAMLNFSHLEKETRKLGERHYRITLKYYSEDETEILIRVLSFGPLIKVLEPDSFVDAIRRRLQKQRDLQENA